MMLISNLTSLNSYLIGKKPFKNEKSFTGWLNRKIKDRGGFAFKISDFDMGYKPCDDIIAWDGEAALVEIKYTKHSSCYPFRMLKGSSPTKIGWQVEGLSLYAKNGGKSLVLVYSGKENCFLVMDFTEIGPNTKISFKS